MQFFLDTAKLEEIQEAAQLGILDGVTTNPSLMASAGIRDFNQHYIAICEAADGPVSAEVISVDYEGMVAEGKALAALHPHIIVKVPMLPDGVKAIKTFTDLNIRTNCTLIFNSMQALLAAKAGATYVSPFVGRLDDIGHDGMELIRQIRKIFDNYKIETQILSASIRHVPHMVESALAGADVATFPYTVLKSMFNHPLTHSGLEKFLADHAKLMDSLKG